MRLSAVARLSFLLLVTIVASAVMPTPGKPLAQGVPGRWASSVDGQAVSTPVDLRARIDGGVSRVDFLAWWPQLGPEGSVWQVVCDTDAPGEDGSYGCQWPLIGVTPGPVKITFTVYGRDGSVSKSPDGVQAFTNAYQIPEGCEGGIALVEQAVWNKEFKNEACGRGGPGHLYWFDADENARITVSVTTRSPKSPPLVWVAKCDRWDGAYCVRPATSGIQCTDVACFNAERSGYGPVTRKDDYRVDETRSLDARQLLFTPPTPGRYIVVIEPEGWMDDANYALKVSPAWCYFAERAKAKRCPYDV